MPARPPPYPCSQCWNCSTNFWLSSKFCIPTQHWLQGSRDSEGPLANQRKALENTPENHSLRLAIWSFYKRKWNRICGDWITSSGKTIRRTPRVATIDHRWTAPLGQKLNDQRILKQCCCRFQEMGSKTTLTAWYVKRLPTVAEPSGAKSYVAEASESQELCSRTFSAKIHTLAPKCMPFCRADPKKGFFNVSFCEFFPLKTGMIFCLDAFAQKLL